MRRTCVILSVAIPLLIAGCQQEPAVDGRTVSEWLDYARRKDLSAQERGIEQLVACGPDGTPWLLTALQGTDERAVYPSARALLRLGMERPVLDSLESQRGAAQQAIAAACCRENTAVARALAVGFSGLKQEFEAPGAAAAVFEQLRPDASAAVPVLKQALADADPEVRWRAANTACRLTKFAAALTPSCAALLNDQDTRVRRAAARALQAFGMAAQEALTTLESARNDPDPEVRSRVTSALEQLNLAPPRGAGRPLRGSLRCPAVDD